MSQLPNNWLRGGFWIGIPRTNYARYFDRVCLSVNTLRQRTREFGAREWILDSGAFTQINKYGHFRMHVKQYAEMICEWGMTKTLKAAVTQDYMCERFVLAKTGLSIEEHQKLTVYRYDCLLNALAGVKTGIKPPHILPVLQGYREEEYVRCLRLYGERLKEGMWVGVGSICRRNSDTPYIIMILEAILRERPDLKLHGFGMKITALSHPRVLRLLWSADSMAWSKGSRIAGENSNSLDAAERFYNRIQEKVNSRREKHAQ